MLDSINLLWSGYQWVLEFLCDLGHLLGSPFRKMLLQSLDVPALLSIDAAVTSMLNYE